MITVAPSYDNCKIMGRHMFRNSVLYIDFSASYVEFEFTGKKFSAVIRTDNAKGLEIFVASVGVMINGKFEKRFALDEDVKEYVLFESETEEKVTIRLIKLCEAAFGKMGIISFIHDGIMKPTAYKNKKIEFIGDSITCGYGIEAKNENEGFSTKIENPYLAYAVQTAESFDADFQLVSWSGNGIVSGSIPNDVDEASDSFLIPYVYQYTDAGGSSFAGDEEFEEWDFSKFQADIVVINLGTNDCTYTRGREDRETAFEKLYIDFIDYIHKHQPKAEIICSLGVMGQELCHVIKRMVDKLSTTDKKVHYLEFEVQKAENGYGSDMHPSLATHNLMMKALREKIISLNITGYDK
ncbi:MAG: GDSL-type esterase/lipase family protein [Lachnospiraceae bacterium]|nr:GDSL-type esterase/lipase family protein [Lachnospiraceae bacterium]